MESRYISVDKQLLEKIDSFFNSHVDCICKDDVHEAIILRGKLISQISDRFEVFGKEFAKIKSEIESSAKDDFIKYEKIFDEWIKFNDSIIRDSLADKQIERLSLFIDQNKELIKTH